MGSWNEAIASDELLTDIMIAALDRGAHDISLIVSAAIEDLYRRYPAAPDQLIQLPPQDVAVLREVRTDIRSGQPLQALLAQFARLQETSDGERAGGLGTAQADDLGSGGAARPGDGAGGPAGAVPRAIRLGEARSRARGPAGRGEQRLGPLHEPGGHPPEGGPL